MMRQQFGQGFEGLEERTLLAANVTATLVDGTLVITGDASANDISISGGVSGEVDISIAGLGQTLKINGGTTVDTTSGSFSGVTKIVVQGNAGDDTIDISDINITGNLSVNAGAGNNDSINLHSNLGTNIGGGVALLGGGGTDDSISVGTDVGSVGDLTIGRSLFMQTNGGTGGISVDAQGSGDISTGLSLVAYAYSSVDGTGSVDIGNHGTGGISVGTNVLVLGGAGDDTLSVSTDAGTGISVGTYLKVSGAGGNDNISVNASGAVSALDSRIDVAGSALLQGGVGDDQISVNGAGAQVQFDSGLSLIGGIGDDTISTDSSGTFGQLNVAGRLYADGNSGADSISLHSSTTGGGMLVVGGLDDDVFSLEDNTVTGKLYVTGQAGADSFTTTGNTVSGTLALVGGADVDAHLTSDNTSGSQLITQIENILT